jgi:hypothetical protein
VQVPRRTGANLDFLEEYYRFDVYSVNFNVVSFDFIADLLGTYLSPSLFTAYIPSTSIVYYPTFNSDIDMHFY